MNNSKLHIKNMVCPRCIDTVREICIGLKIPVENIQLGEVTTQADINEVQKESLRKQLEQKGFELLQDYKSKLIGQVKTIIIEQIHHNKKALNINFSTLLSDKLNQEYTALSRLFSSVEGITIERFVVKQKIERVKELIFYNELTLSEIAFQLGYSSVPYLSAQFKKETGMTPSAFKKLNKPGHQALDQV